MKKIHKLLILLALVCTLVVCCVVSASAEEPIYVDNNNYKFTMPDANNITIVGVTEDYSLMGTSTFMGILGDDNGIYIAKQIGDGHNPLFAGITELENPITFNTIHITNGVQIIKDHAFFWVACPKYIITSQVHTIEPYAFYGSGVQEFEVKSNNKNFYNDEFGAIYSYNNELISVPNMNGSTSYKIKDGTTTLAPGCLLPFPATTTDADGQIHGGTLTIPVSVTEIKDSAATRMALPTDFYTVYFEGTLEQWNAIKIGDNNNRITKAHLFVNDWEDYSTATCTEPAKQIRQCHSTSWVDCPIPKNHTETRDVSPALGHDYSVLVETVPSTCATQGTKTYKCSRCDETTVEYLPLKTEHEGPYEDCSTYIAPTCCDEGLEADKRCSACGVKTYTGVAIAPTGNHIYGEWYTTVEPTCCQTGVARRDCTVGEAYETTTVPATQEHNFGDWVTTLEPTCVALGEERRDCTVGDYFETRELAIVDVHVYDDNWKVIKAPTCISEGIEERRCTLCGEVPEERPIPPTGIHTWRDNWFVTIQPTCTTPGLERHYCYYCSVFETREIEPVAHIYRHWESMLLSKTDPTCTTPGEAIYKCHWYDECGTTNTEELPVVDHAYGEYEEVTPATCIKDGLEVAKCQWFDECGKDISQPIPATGEHVWANAPFNIVLSTCTTYGYKEYKCVYHESGCTEINKVYLTALDPDNHAGPINHDLNKKYPTCCSAGYSGDTYCTACDAVMWKGESIPATGEHVWKEAERFDGNCKISGYIKYRCENGTAEHKEDLGVNNSKHYKTEVRNYKAGNCQTMGYSGDEYCTHCNTLIRKGKEIKGSHVGRQKCEICGYNICGCQLCHGTGLQRFIMKMFLWIYKIFGQNKTCACGNVHY